MRITRWAVVAGTLVAAGAAVAASDQSSSGSGSTGSSTGSQSGMHHSTSSKSVTGTIENIQGDTVTIKSSKGKTADVSISGSTKFSEKGKPITKD